MGGSSPPPPLPTLFVFFPLVVVGIVERAGISYTASPMHHHPPPCFREESSHGVQTKLLDPWHRLSSWVREGSCAWEGVGCSNITGHVIQLGLRSRHNDSLSEDCAYADADSGCKWTLRGEIRESLLSLQHLRHLDLSANSSQGKPIPEILGSLRRLTYLNLSSAGFNGRVPDQLGDLSHLHHLDLSYNVYNYDDDDGASGVLYLEDAGWISRLSKMNSVSFANASNRLEALNALSCIQVVELDYCELAHFPCALPHVNFTSLTILDLPKNYRLNSSVPEWLFNVTTLQHLHLGGTRFNWLGVPVSIAELTSLQTLDLSMNVLQIGTKAAKTLSNLCNLQSLVVTDVGINDEPINLQVVFSNSCLLFSLEELDLSYTYAAPWFLARLAREHEESQTFRSL